MKLNYSHLPNSSCRVAWCALVFFFGTQLLLSKEKLPNDVRWVRESMEYANLCEQVFQEAVKKIRRLTRVEPGPPAVVVDLDETILDNSTYQVERWKLGKGFTQESWSEWVNRMEAELVPGAAQFLKEMRKLDVRVVFLSNRMHANLEPTRKNLKALGVLDPKDLFLLRLNEADTKTVRRQEVIEGTGRMRKPGAFTVVGYFGDQIGDFPTREKDRFGEFYFLLPNPMYGKW